MSRTKSNKRKEALSGDAPAVQETRIDQAHHHGGEKTSGADVSLLAVSPESGESALLTPGEPALEEPMADLLDEQLRRQAEQLAQYLRARQRELDHRESQLNAQSAQLESDARTARIWLGEREADLQDRQREHIVLETELGKRLDRLAAAEAVLERRTPTLGQMGNLPHETVGNLSHESAGNLPHEAEMQQALLGITSQWKTQTGELASQSIRAAKPGEETPANERVKLADHLASQEYDLSAQEKRLDKRAQELALRQHALEGAEHQTAEAQAEIRRLHEQLLDERQSHREEMRGQRQRMAMDERRAIAELDKKRELLERRAEQIDQSRRALEQLRAELKQLHRETLEIRLATEELWAQLSGDAPPAALVQSLGRIRTQLADQYRLANAELLQQKKELISIRDQLAGQYEKLIDQRRQFERWAESSRQQADRQAARLIAREQELKEVAAHFAEQSERWAIERREYEQEIRRLRLELMPRECSAKVA